MNKIEDYNFDKNDWAHFHDVILDVTWNNGKINLNQEEMEKLFWILPEDMRMDAHKWGMNDTLWRDNLWVWYNNYERNEMRKVV
jgi:hypothetical protein